MKKLYLVIFILLLYDYSFSQSINIAGQCVSGTVTLSPIGDIDGKPAFEGTGTVSGEPDVTVHIFWMAEENLWVIAYDGQPYYSNSCDLNGVPGTANADCSWEAVEGQSCTGAQPLSITGNVILPVRLTGFTATYNNSIVHLKWETASEINNKGFEIERSADGINWSAIGFVSGTGNSHSERSYQYTDALPLTGYNYYRLAQYDIDGRVDYSPVVLVISTKGNGYSISNNPGNGIYSLTISNSGKTDVSVTDRSGKILIRSIFSSGTNQINISRYPAGVYFLRIHSKNNIITEKLIKQ